MNLNYSKIICLIIGLLGFAIETVGQGSKQQQFIGFIKQYDASCDTVVAIEDSIFNESGGKLLIAQANGIWVTVFVLNDTESYVFQKVNRNWALIDSFKSESLDLSGMTIVDLNGDGFEDVRIAYPVMRGNNICLSLIYNPGKRQFHHNEEFDLINIGFDSSKRYVRSCALGGLFDNSKRIYKVKGNNLILIKSVEMEIYAAGKYGTVKIKTLQKNGAYKTRIFKKSGNGTHELFERLLWSDDLDYFDKGRMFY